MFHRYKTAALTMDLIIRENLVPMRPETAGNPIRVRLSPPSLLVLSKNAMLRRTYHFEPSADLPYDKINWMIGRIANLIKCSHLPGVGEIIFKRIDFILLNALDLRELLLGTFNSISLIDIQNGRFLFFIAPLLLSEINTCQVHPSSSKVYTSKFDIMPKMSFSTPPSKVVDSIRHNHDCSCSCLPELFIQGADFDYLDTFQLLGFIGRFRLAELGDVTNDPARAVHLNPQALIEYLLFVDNSALHKGALVPTHIIFHGGVNKSVIDVQVLARLRMLSNYTWSICPRKVTLQRKSSQVSLECRCPNLYQHSYVNNVALRTNRCTAGFCYMKSWILREIEMIGKHLESTQRLENILQQLQE